MKKPIVIIVVLIVLGALVWTFGGQKKEERRHRRASDFIERDYISQFNSFEDTQRQAPNMLENPKKFV